MLWIILLLLLISFLVYLLVLPVDIVINTNADQYYMRLGGLGRAEVIGNPDYIVGVRFRNAIGSYHFYPLKKRKKSSPKKQKKKSRFRMGRSPVRTAYRLLRSFEVRKLSLDIDSGNCITNARIYPVFALWNFLGGDFNINFFGRNSAEIHLRNRPYRIIKSFINLK